MHYTTSTTFKKTPAYLLLLNMPAFDNSAPGAAVFMVFLSKSNRLQTRCGCQAIKFIPTSKFCHKCKTYYWKKMNLPVMKTVKMFVFSKYSQRPDLAFLLL
jgi:hypothetical protein